MCGRGRPVTSTSCEKQKSPGMLRDSWRLCLFGLPEGDGGSGWITENAHVAVAGDFADIDDDLGTEGFCFGGGGFDVVDSDIGEPHGGCAGHGMFHHSADGSVAVFDE